MLAALLRFASLTQRPPRHTCLGGHDAYLWTSRVSDAQQGLHVLAVSMDTVGSTLQRALVLQL